MDGEFKRRFDRIMEYWKQGYRIYSFIMFSVYNPSIRHHRVYSNIKITHNVLSELGRYYASFVPASRYIGVYNVSVVSEAFSEIIGDEDIDVYQKYYYSGVELDMDVASEIISRGGRDGKALKCFIKSCLWGPYARDNVWFFLIDEDDYFRRAEKILKRKLFNFWEITTEGFDVKRIKLKMWSPKVIRGPNKLFKCYIYNNWVRLVTERKRRLGMGSTMCEFTAIEYPKKCELSDEALMCLIDWEEVIDGLCNYHGHSNAFFEDLDYIYDVAEDEGIKQVCNVLETIALDSFISEVIKR